MFFGKRGMNVSNPSSCFVAKWLRYFAE